MKIGEKGLFGKIFKHNHRSFLPEFMGKQGKEGTRTTVLTHFSRPRLFAISGADRARGTLRHRLYGHIPATCRIPSS